MLADLEVDDQPLVGVLAAERRHVAVRRARQRRDHLDAAADQPAGELGVPAAEHRPPRWARSSVIVRTPGCARRSRPSPSRVRPGLRLGHLAGRRRPGRASAAARRARRTACPRGSSRAGSPSRAAAVSGSSSVRDVAPAHQPGRLGRGEGVPVELVEQVDRRSRRPTAGSRRPTSGRSRHRDQLGGTLLLGRRDDQVVGHALARRRRRSPRSRSEPQRDLDPRPQRRRRRRWTARSPRSGRRAPAGAGSGRHGVSCQPRGRRVPLRARRHLGETSTAATARSADRRGRGSRGSRRAATAPR